MTRKIALALGALSLALFAASVQAQAPAASAPTDGAKAAPAAAASAPFKRGAQAKRGNLYDTPGWGLMTRAERNEHRARMRAMKSYDECQAYQAQHHELMMSRAKERNVQLPDHPPADVCKRLK